MPQKKIVVNLTPQLIARIENMAQKDMRSLSNMVEFLLTKCLNEHLSKTEKHKGGENEL